jgi:hypothetical protein
VCPRREKQQALPYSYTLLPLASNMTGKSSMADRSEVVELVEKTLRVLERRAPNI